MAGEWWRLVTGHLVHIDLWHLLLNAVGGIALWVLFRRDFSVRQLIIVCVMAVLAIDLGLWYFSSLQQYAGLSGVLHGVAAAGIWILIRARDRWGWVLAAMGLLKLAIENSSAPAMLDALNRVATEAHILGAIGGLVGVLLSGVGSAASKQTRSTDG